MGPSRRSKIPSDSHALEQSKRRKADVHHLAHLSEMASEGAKTRSNDMDVLREARRMRDEWRQNRYSRLRAI